MAAVDALPERIAKLEAQYDHLATKADLANMEKRLIAWFVGTSATLIALVTIIAGLVIRALTAG